jgi:hypothetical protein
MTTPPNLYLVAGGLLSALAAALHLGCIVFGAPWYRFLGAGEQMARMAESGSTYPAKVTIAIAAMLLVWSAYAFSGAGAIPRLPMLRLVLCAIAAAYLLRGFLFFPLMPVFPGNSLAFWLVSGGICALLGVIHVLGIRQAWPLL